MLVTLSLVLLIVLAVSCWLLFKLKAKIKQQQKELAYAWQELTDARNQNANYRHAIFEFQGGLPFMIRAVKSVTEQLDTASQSPLLLMTNTVYADLVDLFKFLSHLGRVSGLAVPRVLPEVLAEIEAFMPIKMRLDSTFKEMIESRKGFDLVAFQEAAGSPVDVISDGTRLGTLIKFNRQAYAQLAPERPEIAWTLIELDKFLVELFNSAAATMPNFEISRVVYQIDRKIVG